MYSQYVTNSDRTLATITELDMRCDFHLTFAIPDDARVVSAELLIGVVPRWCHPVCGTIAADRARAIIFDSSDSVALMAVNVHRLDHHAKIDMCAPVIVREAPCILTLVTRVAVSILKVHVIWKDVSGRVRLRMSHITTADTGRVAQIATAAEAECVRA